MTTVLLQRRVHNYPCNETAAFNFFEQQKRAQAKPPEVFLNVTHSSLQVINHPGSETTCDKIPLTVLIGPEGSKIQLDMKSADTIGKLKRDIMKKKPQMGPDLNLVCNGKIVLPEQTLCELGVKPGYVFIAYQKCVGG